MEPQIDSTAFGSVTISGEVIEHDVLIRLGGDVKKRKKKLSKQVYGTSHIISLGEAQDLYEPGAQWLIVGAGQFGMVNLSDEARTFFEEKHCPVSLFPTPQAVERWNAAEGQGIGLFHVTC